MYLKFNCNFVIGVLLFNMFLFFGVMYMYMMMYKKVYFIDYEVLLMNSMVVSMNILLDWMSCSFMMFVFLISFVIILYSLSYMGSDKNSSFFILLIFCFVLSMMLMIISPNLISILLGWDGLGLISYCLVIYYQNIKSYNAGMVTAMTNRIGDVLILMAIAWMINFGSWNYIIYFYYENNLYMFIGMLIMVAAMTKSAQIPFSSWLPAAMAAPTPVSSLVHSSTLVTAGVYLLIRFNNIFENYFLMLFMLVVSVLTMFMAGLGAIFEYDLKKIIALSTLSQLGLMISSLCLGMVDYAFFHLLIHALFKSLLFMCAGYIIHGMNDSQDIRYMGNLICQSPLLGIYFNISNLALCGLPFLAGFYSKDMILETILMMKINMMIFILYFLSMLFTVIYTFRLIYFSMINNLKLSSYSQFSDNDFIMLGFMIIIQLMVIFGGSFMSWMMFIDLGGVILSFILKILMLIICLVGGILGYFMGQISSFFYKKKYFILYYFLSEMWFLPYLSTYSLNWMILKLGYFYYTVMDSGWSEYLGGQGLFNMLMDFSNYMYIIQNKNVLIMNFMIMIIFTVIIML
uniref:NADH-ubiquinone oxidoreductase chain 5 n=1 Tax=Polypsocus corruptus TaxID=239259 RepID=A0A8K1ZG59_9NEOP|nr:NADH dehydrogenase subunit 5 [Polypsocus corruptus]